ncbi:reverse transcriptase domain-containing protein [Tanacetum coccineum]
MSTNEQTPLSQPTSIVRNMLGKEQVPQNLDGSIFDEDLHEYCDKNYHQILLIIAKKVHQEKERRADGRTSKKGSDLEMLAEGPKVLSRGAAVPSHQKKVHKEEQCSKGSKRVYSKARRQGEECVHTFERFKAHIIAAAKIRKTATKVLTPGKQKLLPRNIILKEHPRKERKHCQKLKAAQEDIRSQNQRSKSQALRTTYPNHGTERKQDRFTLLTKTPKEILAFDKGKFKPPPPMTTLVEKRNASKFCEFHGEVGHTIDKCMHLKRKIKEMLKAGKLSHLIKEMNQSNGKDQAKAAKKGETSGKDKPLPILMEDGTEGPMIIEAEIGGHCVHRMYVDRGSSSEILYEHCFNRFRPKVKNQIIPAATPLVGFSGEIIWPLGQISLLVKIGDKEHSTSAWMNFIVVRSPSPYNGIIGRPGVRRIRAIPSTAYRMLKFPVTGGTITLRSSKLIPLECTMVSGPEIPQPMIDQVREEKIQVTIHPEYPEQTIAIDSTLTEEGQKKLCGLLRRNLDIFSWRPTDMTGVSQHIAEHRLNIHEGCLPVRQKKRGRAPKRSKAICEEIEKLVEADFKDLNKACPKDGYLLPKIDWNVDSLCGYPFKCFLDTYKGYHQIQMAEEDEEKTAFVTSQEIFCYLKIPFRLKNIRATYQRLVDKAFQKKTGQNLEVEINMKLNPKKCTFGMREGTFLGYKVDADGLRVCPDKVEAVLSLQSQKCLKDVQKLNGKLASLNRFWSKSAEKSLPFIRTLKKCTKKSDFQWTAEVETTFKQMKKLIAKLPMLTAPKEKEELIIYLAAAKEVISAVLMTERDGNQMPIYFVSRALQGPEVKYTPMEKLILALHDIHYRPMTSVKGQILADFIVERPEEDPIDMQIEDKEELLDPWVLFTNGSSCIDGSGSGLIITNPEGVEFTYALKFRFNATNNEAKYEALISGLQIAEQMGVKNLQANVDLKLVANQNSLSNKYLGRKQKSRHAKQDSIYQLCPPKQASTCRGTQGKSIDEDEVLVVVEEEGHTWMTPIYEYLTEEILPEEKRKARSIRPKAGSMHAGPRFMVAKVLRSAYYWPTMHSDARNLIRECNSCQSSNGETPFSLTYGAEAVILVEIGMPTLRTTEVDMIKNNEALGINLDLLEERIEQAAIQETRSKAKLEKYYNARVRSTSFRPGYLVYRNNEASHAKDEVKLEPR